MIHKYLCCTKNTLKFLNIFFLHIFIHISVSVFKVILFVIIAYYKILITAIFSVDLFTAALTF